MTMRTEFSGPLMKTTFCGVRLVMMGGLGPAPFCGAGVVAQSSSHSPIH